MGTLERQTLDYLYSLVRLNTDWYRVLWDHKGQKEGESRANHKA